MNKELNLITICVPSYNYGRYLEGCLNSCLESKADFRLVVLDNASTDNTPQLKARYVADPRVRWYRNDTTVPIQDNWNKAVSLAETKWVKVLPADDRMMSGSIERMYEMVRIYPEAHFHGHLCEVVGGDGRLIRRHVPYTRSGEPLRLKAGEGLPLKLRNIARLKEPTANFYSKEAWTAVGGYHRDLTFIFDISFNVELMANYPGVLWSEYLAQFRRHNVSVGAKMPVQRALDDMRMVNDLILRRPHSPADRRRAQALLLYRAIELASQRWKREPRETIKFLLRETRLFINIVSWPSALATIWRKYRTGDVQKQF